MKKVLFGFLILIGIIFSFLYYSWRQATQLPDWYNNQSKNTQNTLDLTNSAGVQAAQSRLQEKIDSKITQSLANQSASQLPVADSSNFPSPANYSDQFQNKNVEIELNNQEFNELILTKIAKHQEPLKILSATSGVQTNIKDGVLESGTVVNLANLRREQLSSNTTEALDKAIKMFPTLENKDIYLGISGRPKIENGQLKLDENTQVKLGNLSFSLVELSQRLGISQEKLAEKLSLSLQLGRLNVTDVTLIDNKVLLRGSVE